MGENQEPIERSIARAARAAAQNVFEGWGDGVRDGHPGESSERAIEAQIAAAVTGRKPLYYEPWGDEIAEALASEYRRLLPEGIEIHVRSGNLLIYQEVAVRPILESDPDFYLKDGDTTLDAVARISAAHRNGELLGYGARGYLDLPAHGVQIFKGSDLLLYYFTSNPDVKVAEAFAVERAEDFVRAFGWQDVSFRMWEIE